jgi:glycosyltransferase involved in cell wall biosynthesis
MAYVEIVRLVAGWNRTYIGSLPTIANSNWTADQFCRHYPAHDIRAIHPGANVSLTPVSSDWVPFDRRENNFVIVGRVARSKRTDEAIKIVSRLRTTGLDVGLHIVGQGDDEFGSEIERMIADKPWVTWHKALSRDQLETLVTNQKWGLHCYRFEHYGIAPAELQALGCITFVHDSGGQREIILNPDQRYTSADDAVHKISAILRAPQMHQTLVADGLRTASQHTTDKFREKLLAFVEEIMQERASDVVKRDEQWTCM